MKIISPIKIEIKLLSKQTDQTFQMRSFPWSFLSETKSLINY